MRWFPTLVFSHPHSHSSSSLSTTPPASSSSTPSTPSSSSSSFVSASETLKSSSSTPSLLDHKKITRSSGWLFGGTSKRSTRARKLRPVADLDSVVVVPPLTRTRSSSTFDRSSISSVEPQPLPLPRDADYRFPSPKDPPTADRPNSSAASISASAAVDVTLTPGFRMRSVFESQEGRKNRENVETRSTSTQGDNNFWSSALARSAPTSPFASPRRNTKNDEFVPYYYVTPKGNQFWSAPEMPMSEPCSSHSHTPPAFFDFSAFRTDNIPSPTQQHSRSPPGPTSSIIPRRLSLDTSALITRRETTAPHTVHPLPLPPWAGAGAGPSPGPSPGPGPVPPLPSPSAFSQPKAESMPMKNQWQKGKLIGRGTFGTVYVATNRQTGALCAMKEAEIFVDDPKSAECIKQLEQEIKVLSQLKHPNIVQYYGSEIIEERFYIYLEYVHPGSMNKYFREHCGAVTESVVRSFTRHILSGLAYLHSKKTIHRDIKGANLLVDSAGVVKLADFGMAKHLSGHVAELSLKGSPYWMAPELMQAVVQKDNSSDLAFAVDIWSLGCTIIEMFTGKPPWSEYEGAAAMFKVMKDTPPIPETLSADGKDFLRLCFIRNPAERPSASMLLDHRFMKNLQQSDVSSSTQLYNGTALLDMYSPRQLSDPISILNAHNAKGKLAT